MAEGRFKDVAYNSVEGSDNGGYVAPPRHQILRSKAWPFVTGVLTSVAIVLVIVAARHIIEPRQKTAAEIEDEEWNHCGRSSKVAMEKGCVMEPLFYGWMPPQCVFQELTTQYPVFEDRKWFKDENMTLPISSESLWKGEHNTIYTGRYHGEHCLFQWRKLQFAMDKRMEFLDNKTISAHHTGHCADQLAVGCEGDHDVNTVGLGFYRCRKTVW